MSKKGSWLPNAAQKKQSVQSLINKFRKQFAESEKKISRQKRKALSKSKPKINRYAKLDEARLRSRLREGRPEEFQKALVNFKNPEYPYQKGKGYVKAYVDRVLIPYLNSDEYKQAVKDLSANSESKMPHENVHLGRYQLYKDIVEDNEAADWERKEATKLMFEELYALANNKMTVPEIHNRLEYLKSSNVEILDAMKNIKAFKNSSDKEKISAFWSMYRDARSKAPSEYDSSNIMDVLLSDQIEEIYDQGKAAINPQILDKALTVRKAEDDSIQRSIDRAYKKSEESKSKSIYLQNTERYKFLNNPKTKIEDIEDMTAAEFQQVTGTKGKVNQVIMGKTLGLFDTIGDLKTAKWLIENATRPFKEFNSKQTHGYDMYVKAKELADDKSLNEARRESLFRSWLKEYNSKKSNEEFAEAITIFKR